MPDYPEVALVWVDVETDGLVAHKCHLLEIAIIITDLELNQLEVPYQAVIRHRFPWWLRRRADPYVQHMHDRTGLWGNLRSGRRQRDVEREVLAYIKRFASEPKTARIAGNSVKLDLAFLEEHLPAVADHLHHRVLDVSTIAGAAAWWQGVDFYPKRSEHSALSDIQESIAEMRYLRERLGI